MDFGIPPLNSPLPVSDNLAQWPKPWANWLTLAFIVIFDVQNSGVTANRPTKNLYIAKPYFDTTLGMPIWWDGTQWVDATGAPA